MQPANASQTAEISNGAGTAAALAAGAASFLLAILSILGDKLPKFRQAMIFYRPTGPLSGVTTCAILLWLLLWIILHLRWCTRSISSRANIAALALLCLGVLLTFPPIADLF
ncbi:hypothetical protein ACFPT7_14660 [Acidicapsa dinghuensis]|uniref:Uncharacterized protein n=1 Tax=Acidicapsa dinghuensis TaxID=2218256 RepID=A0ABW1EJV7_9BACT|nr:hypothetical protein [Acidicapsa dinghuensis]